MNNNHKIQNLIFDWSGVISNDFLLVHQTYLKIFRHYRKPSMTASEFKEKFRLPYMDFCREYLDVADEDELSEIFKKFYAEEQSSPEPIGGVENILRILKEKDKTLIVLSSHSFVTIETKRFFPGKKYFHSIYEDIPNKELAIEQVIKEMNFALHETAYIGDMVHDIRAGKKGQIRTAAVLTGYQSRNVLEEENPDFVLETLDDIFNLMPL